MSKLRLLLADDRQQVRQELRAILALVADIEVVGEAADGLEAVRLVVALQPQTVLLDLEMPVMDGYQAARQIKATCPTCYVIALTIHDDETVRRRAADSGVDAFVVKGTPISVLVKALGENKESSHGAYNQTKEKKD